MLPRLFRSKHSIKINRLVRGIRGTIVRRCIVAGRAVKLQQHIVTDRVHECPKPFRAADTPFGTERFEDPQESLLLNIFNRLGRAQAGPELDYEEFAEIPEKVLFSLEVPIAEALEVDLVEIEKFHTALRAPVSISLRPRQRN